MTGKWAWTAVAAAAALVVAAPAPAAPQAKLSTKIVGSWSRKISSSDVARGKPLMPATVLIGATCKLSVQSTGATRLDCGRLVGALNGQLVPLSANAVRITLGDGRPNSYRWSVSGGHLTLTAVSDPSHDRQTIFRGTWQRA